MSNRSPSPWSSALSFASKRAPRYHRFLSTHANQQLLCDHLASQGLKAAVKPLSVNCPVGEAGAESNWVATTTLLLTLTIWEPTRARLCTQCLCSSS